MKELITRVEELAVQAARDSRQIETLQGLLKALQSDLMAELTDAIKRKKKIDELASENAALIVSESGHKKAAREAQEKYEESHRLHSLAVEARNNAQEEVRKLRAEVPLESTREALKNAVAKLQEVTTERDRMRLQLENARADLKQALVERGSLGSMAADRVMEIRKLMDGHAEDMKAQAELTAQLDSTKGEAEEWLKQCHAARRQRDEVREEARKETQRLSDLCAELQSKYESLLAKTTDLLSIIEVAIDKATEALSQLTA